MSLYESIYSVRYLVLGIFLLIVLLIISYNSWLWYSKKNIDDNGSGSRAGSMVGGGMGIRNASSTNSPLDIYFFYATWCPHCKTALPKWNAFCDSNNNKVINGSLVYCHTIDCTDNASPEVINKLDEFDVKGFPTVKMVKDGIHINFDTKITESALKQFVEQMTAL